MQIDTARGPRHRQATRWQNDDLAVELRPGRGLLFGVLLGVLSWLVLAAVAALVAL
jgi:hypothetical protein